MAFNPSSPSSPSSPSNPSNPSRPPFPPRSRFGRDKFAPPNKDEHRINERIRVPQVRLVDELGNQVGVVATQEALRMARERGLDLMEVSPNSNPPVCKITDYGKFKYEKKKKDQQAKKKQVVIKVKEIQLRPQTDEHDLDYKFRAVESFLKEGDKAKITILFRGREIVHAENGMKIMHQLADRVKDFATVEAMPKLEGKKMIMILAPGQAPKGAQVRLPTPGVIIPQKAAVESAAGAPSAPSPIVGKIVPVGSTGDGSSENSGSP